MLTSIIDDILSNVSQNRSLSQLKVLRLLRVLRPLRIVTHSHSMQMLVSTLFASLSGIANVVVLLLIVWLMFAILGDSIFSNRLIYCSKARDTNEQLILKLYTHESCLKVGGDWISYPLNYDTVPNGILTLLVVSSLNNWDQNMYQAVDSSGEDTGPV